MKRAASGVAPRWQANGDWTRNPGPPEKSGRLIHDLVNGHGRKVSELHLDDRTHSLDGGPDRTAHHGILTNGSIQNPPWKFFGQILGGLESASEISDVLTVNVHPFIVPESLFLRFPNRFEVCNSHRT